MPSFNFFLPFSYYQRCEERLKKKKKELNFIHLGEARLKLKGMPNTESLLTPGTTLTTAICKSRSASSTNSACVCHHYCGAPRKGCQNDPPHYW